MLRGTYLSKIYGAIYPSERQFGILAVLKDEKVRDKSELKSKLSPTKRTNK